MKKILVIVTILMTVCFLQMINIKEVKDIGSGIAKATATKYKYQVLNESKKTATITQVENPGKCLIIPNKIDGYTITQVGVFGKKHMDMFSYTYNALIYPVYLIDCDTDAKSIISEEDNMVIEEIRFPETVEIIGSCAFKFNYQLKKIVFPKKLRIISDGAFYGCLSLENVNLGKSMEGIGYDAFGYCFSIRKLEIKSNKVKLGIFAFSCSDSVPSHFDKKYAGKKMSSALIDIKLPFDFYGELLDYSLSSYMGKTFKWLNFKGKNVSNEFLCGARNLKRITFPKGVKKVEIGINAINTEETRKKLVIPASVKKFVMHSQSRAFEKVIIQGKNTKVDTEYMDTLRYRKGVNYISAKTIIAPKGSKAEKFTEECYYPAEVYDRDPLALITRKKDVEFIGVSLPKKPSLSVKKRKVKWKKIKNADGYEVYYSSKKKGTYKKLTETRKRTFAMKKNGYVKIRSIKNRYGVDWKSKWSNSIKVKR